MEKQAVNIKKLHEQAVIPTYGSEYSAGADLYACIEEDMIIQPGETRLVPTGLAMEIPVGLPVLSMRAAGWRPNGDLRRRIR